MDSGKSINNTKKRVAVLWHQDQDGFGAAYACWKALSKSNEMKFIPVQYGQEPPYEELRGFAPNKIYIVDFSYKAPVLNELSLGFVDVFVIDHHKTASDELYKWNFLHVPAYLFDPRFSGATLTWKHFFPNETTPTILNYVQDRDLWKFELQNSKEVNAYIATLPWDFEVWDAFSIEDALLVGAALVKQQEKQIKGRLKDVRMVEVWEDDGFSFKSNCGWRSSEGASISSTDCTKYFVPVVNATENISELGEAMCLAYPDAPFSVSYADRADGKRSYSLRSRNGFDVSEVAKAFNGGGHPGSSGFCLPSPEII